MSEVIPIEVEVTTLSDDASVDTTLTSDDAEVNGSIGEVTEIHTSNYPDLTNLPKINGETLLGNQVIEEYTEAEINAAFEEVVG